VRDANKGITSAYNKGSGIECMAFLCQIFSHSGLKLSRGNEIREVLAMISGRKIREHIDEFLSELDTEAYIYIRIHKCKGNYN